jgi:peptide/nickel transport system permease protein
MSASEPLQSTDTMIAGPPDPEAGVERDRIRLRKLLRDKPLAVVGVVIFAAYTLLAIAGPFFVADPLSTNAGAVMERPSAEFLFGTDRFGRDVFARSVHAARLDLSIGIVIAVAAMIVGSLIGVVSGYWGGRVDDVIQRLTDMVLAFPAFVLALVLVAAIGDSIPNVMIAVGIAFVPHFVRLTRAQVLAERELEYVEAARIAGNRPWRIAFLHVMPNSIGPSFVQGTLVAGWAILNVAGLAFLGVGIRPPQAEWGVMVAEGANDVITGQWWTALFPGGMIVLAVMAFHFVGDELRRED